jgi:tetratricopeptide (TPR) repeat protein
LKAETVPSVTTERGFSIGRAAPSAPALVAFVPVFGLAAAQGGYFPTSWGWASVPLFWAAAIVLVIRSRVELSVIELLFLGVLIAFTGWLALSAAWSSAPAVTVLEIERVLVYVSAVSAALLASRARSAGHVLGGLLTAISLIAAFSLATRLAPDRVGVYDGSAVYRLAQPIGYWNGLALFAAMGGLLALGFAARARTIPVRAAASAALVILLPTFYFTFGRAAWIALAAGLVVAVAVDPSRLQLLATLCVVGPAPAAAVLIASHESALTHSGAPLARAAHDGHRLGLIIVLLACANAVLAGALGVAARRIEVGRIARRVFAVAVGLAVAAAAVAVFARYGDPVTLARKGYTAFKAPPPHVAGNLNQRLLSFSGNGRADLWRLAWDDARGHPVVGSGAGTYERYFLAHQPADVGRVRDAHGLYLETLAELGPVGLALLVAVLLVPLLSLRFARRHPLVPGAVGAYVAYLVHTGVDWDWELPAVTLVGLFCSVAILLFARERASTRSLAALARWVAAVAAVVAAIFAGMTLLGNSELSRSESAREHERPASAASHARKAHRLLPWSAKPWEALGRAQLAAGFLPDARRSFRKAISMDDGDWRLWYDLANATTGRARRLALERAVALFPRSGLLSGAERGT